eukprot:Gb_02237 [translate_table: standard]
MVTMDTQAQLPRHQQQSQDILQIDPVGIEDQAAEVKKLLHLDGNTGGAARAVVIYGFGGIGKTTLAEYVVSKCLSLEGLKFSEIRIDDKNLQITKLQEKIIFDVGGMRNEVNNASEGQRQLSKVLENQPCFLFIDNVVDKKHVQDLLPKKLSLPSRSRILITSRENNMRQVLDLQCKEYSVECLPSETARKLLHQIILDGDTYKTNERKKMDAVADACSGVPLLLEVYGKHLRDDREDSAYDEALASLLKGERGAYKEEDLSAKLLFVYHKMREEDTKDAFLDICCFFHEWQRDTVSAIVGEREIVALNRGALLKINEGNQVIVHDVIKVMGIDEAKHTRLQSLQDLKMALEENKNLNRIKGIWLPHNENLFHLESKHLDAMCDSLRVLSIGDWIKPEGQCEKKFKNLRYLDVGDIDAFPFNEASKIENLTVLSSKSVGAMDFHELPKSLKWLSLVSMPDDTTQVPRIGWRIIENMRHLQGFGFQGFNVLEFPGKFVLPKSLSELDFSGCEQLKNLPQGFEHLSALTDLTLDGCKSLREVPKTVGGLRSLKSLSMKGCDNLIELPEELGSLSCLNRLILEDCNNLKTLAEGVGNLVSLEELNIRGCKSLAGLPTDFGNLSLLTYLDLSGCESFVELPQSFGNLCNLSRLEVDGCNSLTTLPIQNLSSLKNLNVTGCSNLQLDSCSSSMSLLPNLKLLKYLRISDCDTLTSLPDGFGRNLTNLETLRVQSCDKFERVSSDFECLTSLRSLDLGGCPMLEAMTMDKVVRLKNLWEVNIRGSVKLEEKWEQMQKEEDQYSFVVRSSKTVISICSVQIILSFSIEDDVFQGGYEMNNLCWRAAGVELFYGECSLVDLNGQCIPSSEFTTTDDSFIFVIAYTDVPPWKFQPQVFQKMIERLTSESLPIIYVDVGYFSHLLRSDDEDEENIRKTLELLPDGSLAISSTHVKTRSLLRNACNLRGGYRMIIADVKADGKGLKRFVHRNEISSELWPDEPRTPQRPVLDNILELEDTLDDILTRLWKSNGLHYFLRAKDNSNVNIGALQGKVVAIFMCNPDTLEFFKLEECYNILQHKHCNFEAVWTPIKMDGFDSYARRTKSMPWLLFPDPTLFTDKWHKAYPFSEEKIEELKRKEVIDMQRQSPLEFVLGDSELEDSLGAKVAMDSLRGKVIFLYSRALRVDEGIKHTMNCVYRKRKDMEVDNFEILCIGYRYYDIKYSFEEVRETYKQNMAEEMPWVRLTFKGLITFFGRCKWLKGKHNSYLVGDSVKWQEVISELGKHIPREYSRSSLVVFDEDGKGTRGRRKQVVEMLCREEPEEEEMRKEVIDIMRNG